MLIRHISIVGTTEESSRKGKVTQDEYVMRVNFANNPNKAWKQYFASEWRRMTFARRRRVKMDDDVLKLVLMRTDNIQTYIDYVKSTVNKINHLVGARSESGNGVRRKLQMVRRFPQAKRFRMRHEDR